LAIAVHLVENRIDCDRCKLLIIDTSLAIDCRNHGLLLHIHRAMHAVIDRQKIHEIHFRVLAKCLRMSGGDHLHSGTVVGKLEGDRAMILGF